MKNNKFWTYFNKKGYFVILILCILTIIGTTTVITNNNLNTLDKVNEENYIDLDEEYGDYDLKDVGTINAYQNELDITKEDIQGSGSATVEDISQEETKELDANIEEEGITVASNKEIDNNQVSSPSNEETEEKTNNTSVKDEEINEEVEETFSFSENTIIQWPLLGEIVMDFSSDKLVYDKTLEEYRVHPAICISSSEGEEVKAAARGKVEIVKNDPEIGITVVLNHGDGWKTIYGQLQKEVSVKQGEIVEKGQVVGKIGLPTKYSTLLGKHVYFKIEKDGKAVNPRQFQQE